MDEKMDLGGGMTSTHEQFQKDFPTSLKAGTESMHIFKKYCTIGNILQTKPNTGKLLRAWFKDDTDPV